MGRDRERNGFTLVEVLLAVFIFSVSIFALVPLLTTATRIDREACLNVRARAMAADILDSLMADAAPPFSNPSTLADRGATITRAWSVERTGNLDHLAVTVQYDYEGRSKVFTLVARKTR